MLVESFDEVFDTPLTYNYNVAFERELRTGWMARAAYVGSTATTARSSITLNPAIYTPGGPTGNPDARRAMPEYGSLGQFVQDRSSRYNSMQLTLNRRYADGFTVRASYTLADLQGTIGGPEMAPGTSILTWTKSSTHTGMGAWATFGAIASSHRGCTTFQVRGAASLAQR